MSPRVKIDGNHHAIMWISTKGILREHEEKVMSIINEKLLNKNVVFYGFCFGRFDLIVEFIENSARVASHYVCELQDKIEKEFSKNNEIGDNAICSSLTLACGINKKGLNSSEEPIRMYTFLRPKNINLDLNKITEIIENLNTENTSSKAELFWNSSAYSFILAISGSNFHKMFSKILNFRGLTEEYFSESCTYVGRRMDGEEEKCTQNIKALTFVKLSKGYGELLNEEDFLLGWRREKMDKRLGWSDISLEIEKPTLMEIKTAILGLRKNHEEEKDIANTSTLLLPKEEKK